MKEKYAVLVIDMQNDFIEDGAVKECEGGREIIRFIKRLLEVSRRKNIPVVYTKALHRPDGSDLEIKSVGQGPDHCREGTRGAEIIEELRPGEKDYIVIKRRYSAFYKTDLEILLAGRDICINTLITVGVSTNVCVRGTIQDAYQKGFRVLVPRECVAATTRDQNNPSLQDINNHYGEVLPLEEVIKRITGEGALSPGGKS